VRRSTFGLVDLVAPDMGGRLGPGRACDIRSGDCAFGPREGLKGGRRMELCRGGDRVTGLRCDGIDGETCVRGRWGTGTLTLGKCAEVDDNGRSNPLSSAALHDPLLDPAMEAGAVEGPGPPRGDKG